MTDTVETFFAAYAAALLARDEQAVADLYAVPALVLFPGTSIAVGDRGQTAASVARHGGGSVATVASPPPSDTP